MAADFRGDFPIGFFGLAGLFQMRKKPPPQHAARDPSLEIGIVQSIAQHVAQQLGAGFSLLALG